MAKRKERLAVEARNERKKPSIWGLMLLRALPFLLAVLLLLGAVSFCRKKLYYNNPLFQLKKIETSQTDNFSSSRIITILSEMGVESGRYTLPLLPLREIRQRFLKEPIVGEVRVRRIYPDTLQVTLVERVPVAYLHFPGSLGLPSMSLDRHGVVLPGNMKGATSKLPIINHIPNPGNLKIGERTENTFLLGALYLLNQLAVRPEGIYYDVFLIQLNQADHQLILRLNERGVFRQSAQVIVSLDHIAQCLDRLKHIVKLRMESGQTISYIDVSYEKNVPVRP
jgi:cell division septal protein FtsQ